MRTVFLPNRRVRHPDVEAIMIVCEARDFAGKGRIWCEWTDPESGDIRISHFDVRELVLVNETFLT